MTTKPGKLPELLAPCGSPEILKAAVAAGADAVYFGGTQFNARMKAKNFDRAAIADAIGFCHANGVRAYITLNTLVGDRSMRDALQYAQYLYNTGADAVIIADLGLAAQIREYIPGLRLHASTQMSGHNAASAAFLSQLGFSRMVCARELSRENIEKLVSASPIEIEQFVHGALCVSHSGQCLFSSLVGGRSGNRGECAQPCRLPYNGRYPLSLKDNCLAGHIKEIIASGVASLKIEGRMKGVDYVFSTVSAYRHLLDEGRDARADEIGKLAGVFSRSGFTDGYYTGKISQDMLGVRTDDDKTKSANEASARPRTDAASAVSGKKEAITQSRSEVLIPENAGKQRRVTGGAEGAKKCTSARFYNADCIPAGTYPDYFDIIYLPLDRFAETSHGRANGVILPPVITDSEADAVRERLRAAVEAGAVHALVGNAGHIALAREAGLRLHGDFRLNVESSFAMEEWRRSGGFEDIIVSPELTVPQIRDIPGNKSVIVYGRVPLMLLEKPVGTESLRDRRGVPFPVIKEGGRDIILNSVPVYMADRKELLAEAGALNCHFIFTNEGKRETEAIIYAYMRSLPTKKEVTRIKR